MQHSGVFRYGTLHCLVLSCGQLYFALRIMNVLTARLRQLPGLLFSARVEATLQRSPYCRTSPFDFRALRFVPNRPRGTAHSKSRAHASAPPQPACDEASRRERQLRRKLYLEHKSVLRKLLRGDHGIQYVEHAEGHGDKLAACRPGLEGIVSK